MRLQGYSIPRTRTGRASLVPPPPWHYVGDFLVVDYWADPDAVRGVLPEGLEPHPDPGRCAAVFADWQSCFRGWGRAGRPDKVPLPRVLHRGERPLDGEEVTDLPVHLGGSGLRAGAGLDPGFPKETRLDLDDPHIRPRAPRRPRPSSRRPPRRDLLGPRPRHRRYDRHHRRGERGGAAPQRPAHHQRAPLPAPRRRTSRRPAGARARPRRQPRPRSSSKVVTGPATLTLHSAPGEEHDSLAPIEIDRGYRFTFGYTIDDLETVKELV